MMVLVKNGHTLCHTLSPYLGDRKVALSGAMKTKMKMTGEKRPRKVFYICDRKRCDNCSPECRHTQDIGHALYTEHEKFDLMVDGSIWERVRDGKA